MIVTANEQFGRWGEAFGDGGDPVAAVRRYPTGVTSARRRAAHVQPMNPIHGKATWLSLTSSAVASM